MKENCLLSYLFLPQAKAKIFLSYTNSAKIFNLSLKSFLLTLAIALLCHGSNLEAIDNKSVRIQVNGIKSSALKNELIHSSFIPSFREDKQFWTKESLRLELEEQIPRWQAVLHANGYFDAKIYVSLKETSYNFVVELTVISGAAYEITEIAFFLEEKGVELPAALNIPIELPMRATTRSLQALEKLLLNSYQNSGYGRADFVSKTLEIDTIEKSIKVKWVFQPGDYYTFGPLNIEGLSRMKKKYVIAKVLAPEGAPYNAKLLEISQEAIGDAPQFGEAVVQANWNEAKEGQVPIEVRVTESPPRTFAFGASITTEQGIGTRAHWENRNFTGRGDTLAFRVYNSKKQKTATAIYNLPDFFPDKTDLRFQIERIDEDTLPYNDQEWVIGTFLERRLNKRFFFSYGASWRYLETSKTTSNSKKGLFNFPLTATWSNSTNALNPADGRSHQLLITPVVTTEEVPVHFVKLVVKNGFYFPVAKPITLALGLQAGTIMGTTRSKIPPPFRFYEGGSSSFRGYTYKSVSPLNESKDPDGGRSYVLFSIEPRMRITGEFSFVPFYEVGRAFSGEGPKLEKSSTKSTPYLQSAGFGISYDTIIGPVRFDFATALNRRKGIDHRFQIYLSIGPGF